MRLVMTLKINGNGNLLYDTSVKTGTPALC